MNLEACTKKICSGLKVQKALGLQAVTCEGKGSCCLIAALAAFEDLLNKPRTLTLADRAVDLSCRLEVLDRFTTILNGPDDGLGGLLYAKGEQLRKVFRQLLKLPQVSKRRGAAQPAAGWYTCAVEDRGGWRGDLFYQIMAQCAPHPIPCPAPCCPCARHAYCPATCVTSPSQCVRRCTSHVDPCAQRALIYALLVRSMLGVIIVVKGRLGRRSQE